MTQPELIFTSRRRADADPIAENLAAMLRELAASGWRTARELTEETDLKDRQLRAAANAEASLDEIRHASNWLRHQAGEMTRRAVEIERVRHGGNRE